MFNNCYKYFIILIIKNIIMNIEFPDNLNSS